MSHADDLGDRLYDALSDPAHVPSPVPVPSDYATVAEYQTALAAFVETAARNQWRAFAHEIGGLWIPAIPAPVVVGSTVTSFTVGSGLSLDGDGEWKLRYRYKRATGTTSAPLLILNGDSLDSDYESAGQRFLSGATVANFQTDTDELKLAHDTSTIERFFITVELSKRAGDYTLGKVDAVGMISDGRVTRESFAVGSRLTADVTSIGLGDTASNRILAGTEAMLLRRAF